MSFKKRYLSLLMNLSGILSRIYFIIIIMAILFIAGTVIGFNAPEELQKSIVDMFKKQFSGIINSPDFIMFIKVFLNNVIMSFILLLLGLTLVIPFAIIFLNGQILGIAIASAVSSPSIGQYPILKTILLVLPHGVIEVPMILLSSSLSVTLGLKLFFRKKFFPKTSFKGLFAEIITIYLLLIIPMLLIAAFIEIYITKGLIL